LRNAMARDNSLFLFFIYRRYGHFIKKDER
jgi:hypothetical protein